MLRNLSIRNFAIIDKLDLAFEPGLNVLTGETGAGKSIILGALNVILGGRAGAELVRAGAEHATVDAVFDVSGSSELQSVAEELCLELEDGLLFLSREIGANGKSSARVAGRPAPIAQLKEIGSWLVDLHGQHEHQSLLSVPRHLEILDEWGGLGELRGDAGAAFRHVRELEKELAALETDSRERARLIDLYEFQNREIEEANLDPGEEDDLRAVAKRLANAQKLAVAVSLVSHGLGGDSAGVLEQLAVLSAEIESAAELDERLASAAETLRSAGFELQEVARDLARYPDSIEFNPERLQEIDDRLNVISGLKRKYGDTIEEILEYADKTAEALRPLTHVDQRSHELDAAIRQAQANLGEVCTRLAARRREAASRFEAAVLGELRDLAMEKTRFEVQIEPDEPGQKGADRMEFLIAPNPGEPLRPLARIASGGEISRVMLAIKSAMARQDPLPTMLFDEIDAGVGGRIASVIAQKLRSLSQTAQILCITHLPQIASQGDHHLYIEKCVANGRTSVIVNPLDPRSRVEELARMLGGAEVTETALQHAREMLSQG